jgi:hypothetical protein
MSLRFDEENKAEEVAHVTEIGFLFPPYFRDMSHLLGLLSLPNASGHIPLA